MKRLNKEKIPESRSTCDRGYTLIEASIVALIMLLVCLTIFNLANLSSRLRAKSTLANKLSEDCRSSMHMLARELRESSMDSIYTADDSDGHFAIGFARPQKDSSTEIIDLSGTGDNKTVIWENTVIYHTYDDSGNIKLLRREFARTGGATEHQAEADDAVDNFYSDDKEIIDELKLKDGASVVSFIDKETNFIDVKFTVESEMQYNPVKKTKTVSFTTEVKPMNTGGE